MSRRTFTRTLCLSVFLGILSLGLATPASVAQPGHRHEQGGNRDDRDQTPNNGGQRDRNQPQMSAQEAAAQAQARHGGRVLKVSPHGKGYSVRLLLDDGRVITVSVGG